MGYHNNKPEGASESVTRRGRMQGKAGPWKCGKGLSEPRGKRGTSVGETRGFWRTSILTSYYLYISTH